MFLLFNITVFLIPFIYFLLNKKLLSSSIIFIYLLSSFFSLILYLNDSESYKNLNVLGFFIFYFLLFSSLLPIFAFNENKISEIKNIKIKYLNIVCVFLIIINIPSLVDIIYGVINNLKMLSFNYSFFSDKYIENRIDSLSKTSQGYNYLSIFRNITSHICLFILFYLFTLPKKNRYIVILLIFISFSFILQVFVGGHRSNFFVTLFNIVILYIIFRRYYDLKIKRIVNLFLTFMIFVSVLLVLIVTASRFSQNRDINPQDSVISYAGQSTLNFNKYIFVNTVNQYGDGTAPIFRRILGLESSSSLYERQDRWGASMEIKQGAFYTFIGDIWFDFGPLISIIILIIIPLFIRFLTLESYLIPLHKLFALYMWASICCSGVFYFTYKTIGGNLILISSILFYLLLYFLNLLQCSEKNYES
ncbi:MAG: O-antigen polymerase [Limisphaerales bacterium]|jgi:oligosaccharide repeat unit polymerase